MSKTHSTFGLLTIQILTMTEKMTASVKEDASESTMGNTGVKEDINESAMGSDAVRIQTVDIDNYHGLNAKTILVYLVQQSPVHDPYFRC